MYLAKTNGATGYMYDGEGRRVRKLIGENTRFIYGISGGLIAEFDGSTGNLTKEYVSGGGMMAVIEPSVGTRYTTADHLGSPRVVTGDTGSPVSRHDYKPFGVEMGDGTSGRTTAQGYGASDGLRKQFTGYERDNEPGETGLDYAQARYYSSGQGRFTGADPLLASGVSINPKTWNRYAYALNNPLRFSDPSGLRACSDASCSGRDEDDWLRASDNEDPEAQKLPSVDSKPEEESSNAAAQQQDLEFALLFSDCDAIARGSDTRTTQADAVYGNHFNTNTGVQHSVHIYGDMSGNKVVGLYVPQGFKLKYIGGKDNVVIATNSDTKEVLAFAHVAGVNNRGDLKRNLALNKTNSKGSTYFGDIGGKGGDQDNYRHAHVTLYRNSKGRESILKQIDSGRFRGTGRIRDFSGFGNIASLLRR